MQSPIEYAQKIEAVLAEIDCSTAEIALKIAGELLEYRSRADAVAAWGRGDLGPSSSPR
jgi:hypothetical protein